jgi:carboxypeptidase PM20D1
MLTWLLLFLIALVFFITFLLIRTLKLRRQTKPAEQIEKMELDGLKIAHHLAEAIRCQTISNDEESDRDYSAWLQLHRLLKENYPLIHKNLVRQEINHYSLLYKWPGSESSLKPILFAAHQDVVPVDGESEKQWTHPPFGGEIDKEFVWGRGALDMKNHLVSLMEAVEFLLKSGYSPKRTIYLAFGHDEEIYGRAGAAEISKWMEKQGIQLAAVLDEGGSIAADILQGVDTPVALVCTGEKGFLTIELSAEGKPGHSSAPPRQTAIAIVARAVALLADDSLPADLNAILPLIEKLAVQLPLSSQVMIANPWLFKRMLIRKLEKDHLLNAQLRTTSAATIMHGGIKDNILPAAAQAKVNFRIQPGDSAAKVIDHVKKVVSDPRIEIKTEKEHFWDPTRNSPVNTPAYFTLELAIRQVFKNIPVAPAIFRGATDARHYERLCWHIYRFSPLATSPQDAGRVHGIDERVSIHDLEKMVVFFTRLLKLWGESEF